MPEEQLTPEELAAAAAMAAYRAELAAQIDDLPDGRTVARLRQPIELEGGGVRTTLEIRAPKVRDMRAARMAMRTKGETAIDAFADVLVSPPDAHMAIANGFDEDVVGEAVGRALGKYRKDGPGSS